MKVELLKPYVNKNGFSFCKGRTINVTEEEAVILESNGIIESKKTVKPSKKDTAK